MRFTQIRTDTGHWMLDACFFSYPVSRNQKPASSRNIWSNFSLFILLFLSLFIIIHGTFGQNIVGEWDAYSSTLYIRDLLIREHFVYGASSGGLVQFNTLNNKFKTFGIRDGLTRMDIACIAEDKFGYIWLGMNYPDGEINIWNLESMTVKDVFNESDWGDKLNSISDFVFCQNYAFAVCQRNVDWGVLYFKIQDNAYKYQDFSFNFPMEFSSINSLDIVGDTLWMSTSSGLLYTKLDNINIKSDNWEIVAFTYQDYVSNVIEINGKPLANFGSDIYKIEGDQPILINDRLKEKINSLSVDVTGDLLASTTGGVYRLQQNESWLSLGSGDVEKAIYDSNGNLWGGTSGNGLWHYNGDKDCYFIPNTIIDNIYTSLNVDEEGNLVGASKNGFSFLTEKGWYNICKSSSKIKVDKNHSDDNWDYFVADTICYEVSSRIYTILKRSDNTYFASLYGSYKSGGGGGLLRFNLDDLESYTIYDSTNGRLAASEGTPGGTADYYGVAYMAFDQYENLWICNQYAQNDSVVAILTADDKWYHFSIDDSRGYLSRYLTSITFDSKGRVYFGSEVQPGTCSSNGGLIVLDYNGTLGDKHDDHWYRIHEGHGLGNNSVYSIAFDHNEELWIMTAAGIQRAIISSKFPDKIFDSIDPPVLTSIPFAKECRIRVDGMNNKWITTIGMGIKVYTYNGIWLNDVEGFTTNNSGILDNNVLDIAFYPPEGLTYLATTKGISIYKSPYAAFGKKYKELKIFPAPFKIPSAQAMIIDGLLQESEVKIMTLDGTFIRHLNARDGTVIGQQAFWDGKDESGRLVSSGIYLCLVYTNTGDTTVGKFAIIRR